MIATDENENSLHGWIYSKCPLGQLLHDADGECNGGRRSHGDAKREYDVTRRL